MLLFAIISIEFLRWSIPLPAVLFLGCGLTGIAYTTRKYLASERRRLVPRMNEVCAQVAMLAMLIACLLSIALMVSCYNMMPEIVGGCILAMAFALWIGCIEKAAVPALILCYAIPLTIASFRDQIEPIFEAYPGLPVGVRLAVGFLLALVGFALLARFWYITTSKYSPLVYQASKTESIGKASRARWSYVTIVSVIGAALLVFAIGHGAVLPPLREATYEHLIQSAKDVAVAVTSSLAICFGMYFVWQQLLKRLFPSKQKMSDVGSLLYGVVAWQAWRSIATIYALAIFVGLFLARMYIAPVPGVSEAGPDLIVCGLTMLPFVGATLMLHGFRSLFSRLWIFGASESRSQTAMAILLLVASRSLIFSMLLLPFLLSLGMFSSLGFAPTLLIAIVLIGVGAIPVLVVAKSYPFLVKHESFTVVTMLGLGGAVMMLAISKSRFVIEQVSELIATVGAIQCLLIALIATTAVWWVCLNVAAKILGDSTSVMECRNQMFNPISNA
jgi:hypothetical protein